MPRVLICRGPFCFECRSRTHPGRPGAGRSPSGPAWPRKPHTRPHHPAHHPRLTVSQRSDAFRRRFYPQAAVRDWNDWRWQNRNRVRALADLERMFSLDGR